MKYLLTLICLITYILGGIGLEHMTQAPPIFAAYGAIMMAIYLALQDANLAI